MSSESIVLLLHGLARTSRSMRRMERGLRKQGFATLNIGYPSRRKSIEELAKTCIAPAVRECRNRSVAQIHFVTHSMGGILVRWYLERNRPEELGRVVMLAPPNHGSEIVDRLGRTWWFRLLHGPAGCSLGTGPDSVPSRLGPPDYPVGIICGNRSLDPIFSAMLPRPNDGKVSLQSARLQGMQDFLEVPHGHTFIMNHREVIRQTACFLRTGLFESI